MTKVAQALMILGSLFTETPAEVPDDLFQELTKHFDEPQLVELTAVAAWENYLARLNHALEIPAHGFSEGAYCPLPESSVHD